MGLAKDAQIIDWRADCGRLYGFSPRGRVEIDMDAGPPKHSLVTVFESGRRSAKYIPDYSMEAVWELVLT
jgi:hypothetical protein